MREAPDVILIGEIREKEAMKQALAYAFTGHLCLSTLHANKVAITNNKTPNASKRSAHIQEDVFDNPDLFMLLLHVIDDID